METYHIDGLEITINKSGAREFSKVSYPLRYGLFSEIKSRGYTFQFNLNGEIKFIAGRDEGWPDPSEWLKRTVNNDWIYYSSGGYSGVYASSGEYYLPCLSYPSNSINLTDPFCSEAVQRAIDSWPMLHQKIASLNKESLPPNLKGFLDLVINRSVRQLKIRAMRLHSIIGDSITVLPPDTRHVDYEVIPIIISDGCLHKCGFCSVKSPLDFTNRSLANIKSQISDLKSLYGPDISNYNSIFLAQHDALHSGAELIETAAILAHESFGFEKSVMKGTNLFLFGSVYSLLKSDPELFTRLSKLPFYIYINIGLESFDRETLLYLGKGITPEAVHEAFLKMIEINRNYDRIEITANFVFGEELPEGHLRSFSRLMDENIDRPYGKGCIYFSPLMNGAYGKRRGIKREFYRIKTGSRLPAFIYLIQRL